MTNKDPKIYRFGDSIPQAFTPHLFELEGNPLYMHCSNQSQEHSKIFHRSPTKEQVFDRANHVPKCKLCGFNMKPHTIFFDEDYNEDFY